MPYTGHYISETDVTNWPAGTTAAQKQEAIEAAEAIVEQVLGRHFYSKALDLSLNGNDKNRIFLGLNAPLLTVTTVHVFNLLMDATWYAFDIDSLYVNLDAQTGVELQYLLSETSAQGIFPRGFNNIRVVGTYGETTVPSWIKRAVRIFVEAMNDPSSYVINMQSETIGRYSYSLAAELASAEGLTGVAEVDSILKLFRSEKMPFIMAP